MKHKRPTVGLMCAFVAVGCLLVGQGQPACMAAAQGTRWSIVSAPNLSFYGSRLNAAAISASADNIWAVGMFHNEKTDIHQRRTLTAHWDGISWSIVPSPSPGKSAELMGVTSLPSGEVWGAGIYDDVPINTYDGTYTSPAPLVLRR